MQRSSVFVPFTLVMLASCSVPDPAPEDLDGLMHWLWVNYETASASAVVDASEKLLVALEGAHGSDFSSAYSGELTSLSEEEASIIDRKGDPDPSLTTGFMIATELPQCTIDRLHDLLAQPNQMDQYPGSYDSYLRTYITSYDAWLDRLENRLKWTLEISLSNIATGPYESSPTGGLRRIALDGETDILLAVTYLTEDASFQREKNSMSQDYQIEIYWERPRDGTVMHAWGAWRDLKIGNIDADDPAALSITLSELKAWDRQTNKNCADESL